MEIKSYNHIKQCLEMGHRVRVVDIKFGDTILETVNDMCSKDVCRDGFTDEVQVIPRIPKLLQPGDKGVIQDTQAIREWAERFLWNDFKKELIGKKFTVNKRAEDMYVIYNKENQCNEFIPYFMVAPVPPEENKLADVDTDEMVKELESRGLLVNGKVLK